MKLIRLIVLLLLIFNLKSVFSQNDTILYFATNMKLVNEEKAQYAKRIETKNNGNATIFHLKKTTNNKWIEEGAYERIIPINEFTFTIESYSSNVKVNTINRIAESYDTIFFIKDIDTSGNLIREGYTKRIYPLVRHGSFITYHENGVKYSEGQFYQNEFLNNETWDMNGKAAASNVVPAEFLEQLPSYNNKGISGFRNFVAQNLRYPETAAERGITGIVVVSFTIFEDGTVHQIEILQPIHPLLNAEAKRIIKLSKKGWEAGLYNEKKVRSSFTFPISFDIFN